MQNEIIVIDDATKNPAQIIANIADISDNESMALTLIACPSSGRSQYTVGIATLGERGYTETGIGINRLTYKEASDAVELANKLLFPNRTFEENARIVLSSMSL